MARIDSFLELCIDQSASDLHFHAGHQPTLRRHGELIPIPFRMLTRDETRRFVYEILQTEQQAMLNHRAAVDGVYVLPSGVRFRYNVSAQNHGLSAVFRRIERVAPTLDELMMPMGVKRLAYLTSGLVLITGPTGSGKSTTMTAILDAINNTQRRHVLMIEDPIEFMHTSKQSLMTHRQVGKHVESFSAALKSALREAPDVIVVGELRDSESVSLALAAAETGILVFATLHTNSAPKSISRILDALDPGAREEARSTLALVLRAVVAQTLCRRPRGQGRIAAVEVLLWNEAVAHMIREDKLPQISAYLRSQGDQSDMQSLERHLARHVRDNLVTKEEAMSVAGDARSLELMLERIADDKSRAEHVH